MDASFPFLNPHTARKLDGKDQVCEVINKGKSGNLVWAEFKENGNKVNKAYLLYTDNGGDKDEEWYRIDADVKNGKVLAKLPKGTTHYIFNLVDDKRFMVSYPHMGQMVDYNKAKKYSNNAIRNN